MFCFFYSFNPEQCIAPKPQYSNCSSNNFHSFLLLKAIEKSNKIYLLSPLRSRLRKSYNYHNIRKMNNLIAHFLPILSAPILFSTIVSTCSTSIMGVYMDRDMRILLSDGINKNSSSSWLQQTSHILMSKIIQMYTECT